MFHKKLFQYKCKRSFDEVKGHLKDLWLNLLRSLDDIKETVRNAAKEAVKALESLSLRLCDPLQSAQTSADALSIILPLLLSHGLTSKAESVVAMSMSLVHKIAKSAGKMLIPHVPELSRLILEGMASFEPSMLNYLSFHNEKMGITQSEMEKIRLEGMASSPLSSTLDLCLGHVTKENIDLLISNTSSLLTKGVGMQTRVATARFVTRLSETSFELLKPLAPKLLNSLQISLLDNSPSVRKAYGQKI